MKTSAEAIEGSHVMEKYQRLSGQAGIQMPLQHQLLLFPEPQLVAAAAWPWGWGSPVPFPSAAGVPGAASITSRLGKTQGQRQHYLLC